MSKTRAVPPAELACPPERHYKLYFTFGVKGLALRVTANSARTWVFIYRWDGKSRTDAIAPLDEMNAEEAQKRALEMRKQIRDGVDPREHLAEQEREARARRQRAVTVRRLGDDFLKMHASKKAPGTSRNYRRAFELHLFPRIGELTVERLQRQDVLRVHTEVAETAPVQANRVVAALSSAWTWGQEVAGLVPEILSNPAKLPRGRKSPERRDRGSALTPEELQELGGALRTRTGPLADAFRVYLLTGCRPDEVLGLRWTDLHADGRRVNLKAAKTGPRTLYLGKLPAAIIDRQPRTSSFVFASTHRRNVGGKFSDFAYLWTDGAKKDGTPVPGLRSLAKLDVSVRLYDAGRHNFTTRGYELGYDEHIVRRLTGHTESDLGGAHTRYRHVGPVQLLAAAEAISASLAGDLGLIDKPVSEPASEPAAVLAFPAREQVAP